MSLGDISRERFFSILAGVLFVSVATALSWAVGGSDNIQIFEKFIRPFTIAAAGFGTGHYLGTGIKKNEPKSDLALGFFIGVFFESIALTLNESIGLLPYPALTVLAAFLPISLHFSSVIPEEQTFTRILNLFAGPITTVFLVVSSMAKFLLQNSSTLSLVTLDIVAILSLTIFATLFVLSYFEFKSRGGRPRSGR
jgi:hypothetical protein